jgi:hypothetical protein
MSAQEIMFNLQLFGEGGGAAGGEGAGAGAADGVAGNPATTGKSGKAARNPLADVQYGKAPEAEEAQQQGEVAQKESAQQAAVDPDKAFEQLIKGEYKDAFAKRTQRIIDDRFKHAKGLEAQVQQMEPMLQMLAERYGLEDPKDLKAIMKAMEDDDGYYEEEAMRRDMSVAQLKQMKQMERENAQFKRAQAEQERQQNADRIYQGWLQQSEQVKQAYGNFDLRSEIGNPETGERFMGLLRSGIDVKTAYEVIHKDDIIGGAMAYTAQQTEKRVTDSIRARGMRPTENGSSGNAAAVVRKADVNTLSRKDRDEIARRVMRGERISF